MRGEVVRPTGFETCDLWLPETNALIHAELRAHVGAAFADHRTITQNPVNNGVNGAPGGVEPRPTGSSLPLYPAELRAPSARAKSSVAQRFPPKQSASGRENGAGNAAERHSGNIATDGPALPRPFFRLRSPAKKCAGQPPLQRCMSRRTMYGCLIFHLRRQAPGLLLIVTIAAARLNLTAFQSSSARDRPRRHGHVRSSRHRLLSLRQRDGGSHDPIRNEPARAGAPEPKSLSAPRCRHANCSKAPQRPRPELSSAKAGDYYAATWTMRRSAERADACSACC